MSLHTIVVGAGVVGAAVALQLVRDGHKVTLVDRGPPGGGTSHGNAGGIVPSAAPMATPATFRSIPGMLFDPQGPLVVRWRYLPSLLPWLARFIAECAPNRTERNSKALYALTGQAPDVWQDFLRGTDAETFMKPRGWLKVYSTDAGFEHSADERQIYDRRSARVDVLTQDDLRQLEPALAPIFRHGTILPNGRFCVNPRRLVEVLAKSACDLGAKLTQAEVSDIESGEARVTVVTAGGSRIGADRIVLAAGAFSRNLAQRVGAGTRLEAERGYHVMLDLPEQPTNGPVVWGEKGFVLCPMERGMRVTSQAEFASLDAPPDFRRIEKMVEHATKMLPGLSGEIRERWLGHRPSIPDTLPVIGPAPSDDRVLLAFGHGHLGLTLAAVTARIIADLLAAKSPNIPLEPYRAIR